MSITLRRAQPGDAEILSRIARESKQSWGYPAAWLEAWGAILQVTPGYIEREVVYVAAQGSDVVAFYALVRRAGGWQLDHFWVSPPWQGRGLGRAMFAHVVETSRALGPGVVVIEADPNAAGFYERMGARQTGHVPAPVDGDPSRTLPVFEVGTA